MNFIKLFICLLFGHKYNRVSEDIDAWFQLDGKRVVTCDRCRFVVEDRNDRSR
jgi:hypothetical protein